MTKANQLQQHQIRHMAARGLSPIERSACSLLEEAVGFEQLAKRYVAEGDMPFAEHYATLARLAFLAAEYAEQEITL